MRLALYMRVPLAVVKSWPDREVQLLIAFMAKEPPAEEQIVLGIAQLSALVFNRSRSGNEEGKGPADFLLFADPWKPRLEPTVTDLQVFSRIDSIGRKSQPA